MTRQDLKDFFNQRPALAKEPFAEESGISHRLLFYLLEEKRNLTERTAKKLLPVMRKYGWDGE